ncbi:MAG: TIGR04283 family arsenosugar biosynthesis glycosyltransferase [Planctomycetota bacterium]|jgi:glycosyltransferase involved in cell wall biosynthesis
MRLAVVIPTLNESANLPTTVGRLRAALRTGGVRSPIVVADCGSRDRTPATARALGCEVVQDESLRCRAAALNAGATRLGDRVEVLWFVHADTHVPPRAVAALMGALDRPGIVGGTFDFAWQPLCTRVDLRAVLALVRLTNVLRYRLTGNYYGDQTLFVRREAFEAVGGYPVRLLMEDISICRALRRLGRLTIARGTVMTSPRRFVQNGVLRQLLFDVLLLAGDLLGLEPVSLHERYNRFNRCAGNGETSSRHA